MSRLKRSLPTLEEQRKLRHGVEFYDKQELELELREIVTEICLNPKSSRVKRIDSFVETLFAFMKGLPSRKVSSKGTFSVTCPGLQASTSSTRASIHFQPPSDSLKLIGGYPLRLSFKKGLVVDIAVPVPSSLPLCRSLYAILCPSPFFSFSFFCSSFSGSIFKEEDLGNNSIYKLKKALYMSHLASSIMQEFGETLLFSPSTSSSLSSSLPSSSSSLVVLVASSLKCSFQLIPVVDFVSTSS